jgi:hypothetical protein
MRRPFRLVMQRLVVANAAVVAVGCASTGGLACRAGESAWVDDRLYFGLNTPDGAVSEDQRAAFLRDVVTPRFPDGFTTWRADGQWRDARGRIVAEPSFVLDVVHPDDPATDAKIAAITAAYRTRFTQESVLRVRTPACAAF